MSILQQFFLVCGALLGALSIGAGAFGSHVLKAKISGEMLQIFEIAARYQMYNALTLILLATLMGIFHSTWFSFAGVFLFMGAVIFSGSLYLLIFSGLSSWGAVTPIGGVLMILGWISIFLGGLFGSGFNTAP